jgi:isoamylase
LIDNLHCVTRDVASGASAPLGATVLPGGVNFSVFSKHAALLELLLFDDGNAAQPARIIPLRADQHRTYHYWHAFVPGVKPGQVYAYRAHGTFDPDRGLRFDAEKVLIDPYGLVVAVPAAYDRWAAARPGDNVAVAMKSVVADPDRYDWEGDLPPQRPFAETVIYELHVGGFTRHPSSGVAIDKRGTYAGLIEKIPYLKDLGITAVELLPVFQFDAQDCPPGKTNYWGYAPVSFFAPHQAYSSRNDALAALDEFRDMVKALHRAGLEVILDVVFNRRRADRADVLLSRSRERHLLPPREGQIPLRRLHRLWQHAQRQSVDRAAINPGQPALLGVSDAR